MDHRKTRNEETVARLGSNLGIVRKKKEEASTKDAAFFGASVETDPANDLESKHEACQNTKADESRKLPTDQQLDLDDE